MPDAIISRRYLVADGISVAADVGGDATQPAVILMHGGGQTRHSWGGAMRQLVAAGYHVINLDARGHGDSDWSPDGHYWLDNLSADLLAVLATLSQPVALVGASMGGATALHAVGNSDHAIANALVMVDVVPRIEPAGAAKIAAFMRNKPQGFASIEEAADAVAAYSPHRPRPKDSAGLMKNLRWRDGRLHWHWDPRFVAGRDNLEPPDMTGGLLSAAARVRIPTLLVRGMQSDIVSEAGIDEFRAVLPQLEVYDVLGAGHMVAGDKNDAFNDGVIGFLHRHLPPRSL